jgi:hypothetical protein
VENFLAGRMPDRKQFAKKFVSPLPARVLSLLLFIHLLGGQGKTLLKFCHRGRIHSFGRINAQGPRIPVTYPDLKQQSSRTNVLLRGSLCY